MRWSEARRESHRFAQVRGGACELTLLTQDEPKIVIRFRVIRAEPDRRFERGPGAFDIPSPPARGAEVILSVEHSRFELDRACEVLERLVGLAELSANVTEAIVRGGKLRRLQQRPFVHLGGASEIFRSLPCLTELKERVR